MNVYISVISHGHAQLIQELNCLPSLAKDFTVVLKENTENSSLKNYCSLNNIIFLNDHQGKGFGENNNIVFDYCIESLNMQDNDLFIVLNPDLVVNSSEIFRIIDKITINNYKLVGINLYKDFSYNKSDESIRDFPTLFSLAKSFVGFKDLKRINKVDIKNDTYVDWFAGSFMVFVASHYKKLNGFDVKYFMYCEDVDLCYRSKLLGVNPVYIPNIKAVHLAQHKNRNIISKHFYWHLKSAIRFQYKRFSSCLMYNKF